MEDTGDQGVELFSQHGVSMKNSKNRYDSQYVGTLSLVQYGSAKYVEWKPTEVNVDSDTQDQEWAVVSTGHSSRHRSSSECQRLDPVRLNTMSLKSFKSSRHRHAQHLTFAYRGETRSYITFIFQHGAADCFVSALLGNTKVHRSMKDRNMYYFEDETQEEQELRQSFAELNLFSESTPYVMWNFIGQFRQRPYETTMGAFSKLSDALLYRTVEQEDNHMAELLNHSLSLEEETVMTNVSGEEYEMINSKVSPINLPSRPIVSRGPSLSVEQWAQSMDSDGRITDVSAIKRTIFHGGVNPLLRYDVWKFLLGYYPWNSTHAERTSLRKVKVAEYYRMKEQWKSMSDGQEERFSDFRDRKSLIEKDVKRTDRTLSFFAGDDNPNVDLLYNILMTYVMYNFDLGYVQGMSDLLSPLLQLLTNEADTFWCFVGFMERTCTNFDLDQAGMKLQLQNLHALLSVLDPELTRYLDRHESGNMFFCFRWLLVLFKREFSPEGILHLWEVLWSDLPCPNFHLLFCVAILDSEKETIFSNNYGFTEILKHVNELSLHIDIESTLCKAEALYEQLMGAACDLPNTVKAIIGLEPMPLHEDDALDEEDQLTSDPESQRKNDHSKETVTNEEEDEETAFERAIHMQYL